LLLKEDDRTGEVIIDHIKIEGFIFYDRKCDTCMNYEVYYETYDAFICAYCNKWLEPKCGDPGCQYCKDRPIKPL
jgi:hypothetical protein